MKVYILAALIALGLATAFVAAPFVAPAIADSAQSS
jgi:hypothetical protein